MGITFSRRKRLFFIVNRQKCRLIFRTIKKFPDISNRTILADLHGPSRPLLKNLLSGKTSSHVLKNTLSRHYKSLQLTFI